MHSTNNTYSSHQTLSFIKDLIEVKSGKAFYKSTTPQHTLLFYQTPLQYHL